jgi:glycerol kinase
VVVRQPQWIPRCLDSTSSVSGLRGSRGIVRALCVGGRDVRCVRLRGEAQLTTTTTMTSSSFTVAARPRALVGAIDSGTTSSRFIVFTLQGDIVASHQMEHKQIMPQKGFVEHDPEEIWDNVQTCMARALSKASLQASDLQAIGITNQRETTVVWDSVTGKPYCNAIVWMDSRSQPICDSLAKAHKLGKDRFRAKTGLPLSPYFSGTKIKWILDHGAAVGKAASEGTARFGTIDSWLVWKMSGGALHVTDVTNASRYMLMDLRTLQWDEELCKTVGVPMNLLPSIRPSSCLFCKIAQPACVRGVPLGGVLGDQQAALVGQAAFDKGSAKNTYGTGLFMLLNTGTAAVASTSGLLTTVAYQLGEREPAVYALEGSVAIGGALVQWLRDNLGLISASSQVEELAVQVPDNGGMYIVPAFSGLYAPWWRQDARGVVVGLTRFCDKRHFCRAALEATAFQTFDVFQAMEKDSGVKLTGLRVDGGMAVSNLLMQFQADILRAPVVRPRVFETTALGAAYAAGLAVKVWTSTEDIKRCWPGVDKVYEPVIDSVLHADRVKMWHRAVTKSLGWVGGGEEGVGKNINNKWVVGIAAMMGGMMLGAAAAAMVFVKGGDRRSLEE